MPIITPLSTLLLIYGSEQFAANTETRGFKTGCCQTLKLTLRGRSRLSSSTICGSMPDAEVSSSHEISSYACCPTRLSRSGAREHRKSCEKRTPEIKVDIPFDFRI